MEVSKKVNHVHMYPQVWQGRGSWWGRQKRQNIWNAKLQNL